MKLFELIEDISYRLRGYASPDRFEQEIVRVTADRREAGEGVLFVCAEFALGDGHNSAHAAYALGSRVFLAERELPLPDDATVLVVEDTKRLLGELAARCYGYPARDLTVFGITGTAGKSAIAHTVTALLRRAGRSVASLTTDGVDLNGALRPADCIVPNAADIQAMLREFLETGVEFAVLEFSSYMLANRAHGAIPFSALLLSNFAPMHIGGGQHADLAAYRAAKASLFEGGAPFLVFPANFADFSVPNRGEKCVFFGEGGHLQALDAVPVTEKRCFGTRFTLCLEDGEKERIFLPVPGDNAVKNALAAAALALIAGLSLKEIATGLCAYVPNGRLECVGAYEGRYVFVDSAYTGQDLARALDTLRPYTKGRLSLLIGSVGGRARERRAPLGQAAGAYADFVYLTADNPDCEDARDICEELMRGMDDPFRCCIVPDRRRAIERAVLEMRPGDTLLLAGKGGEAYQLIRGRKERFCEREIVAAALGEM